MRLNRMDSKDRIQGPKPAPLPFPAKAIDAASTGSAALQRRALQSIEERGDRVFLAAALTAKEKVKS